MKVEEVENKNFIFRGQSIEVVPFFNLEQMSILTQEYIFRLFQDGMDKEWNVVLAEFMLNRKILEIATNIDVAIESVGLEKVDLILNGEIFSEVISRIENYDELLKFIPTAVKYEIERYKIAISSGVVIQNALNKFEGLIHDLALMKPEDFKKLDDKKPVEKVNRKRHKKVVADGE